MAWITKNSAGMRVAHREVPYLTEDMRRKFETDILPRFPSKQAATLPALHEVQHAYGYIPYQAIEEVATFLEQDAATVLDTATFYEEFFLEPRGKYTVWVCQSLSCELMGQPDLLDAISQKLGIEPGETTDDGRITLMTVECLGSCGTAPVALVNERLHENVTRSNFESLLDELN